MSITMLHIRSPELIRLLTRNVNTFPHPWSPGNHHSTLYDFSFFRFHMEVKLYSMSSLTYFT